MRWHILIAVAAGTLACGEALGPEAPVGPLVVQPAALQYPPGATVSLTLRNLARHSLLYTPCSSRLEQLSAAGQWVVVYQDPSPCPAVVQYLKPGASEQVGIQLPATLEPTAHRLRFPSIGVPRDGAFVTATQVGDSFAIEP